MNKNIFCLVLITVFSTFSLTVSATEFEKPILVKLKKNKGYHAQSVKAEEKTVALMNIKLSSEQRRGLMKYRPNHKFSTNRRFMPIAINLGMNNVPVLNQGMHGSCVTFANSAAINAVVGKGDYISQLCSLELGNYLEKTSYSPHGWDGSFGSIVLDQFMRFGIVNKENQYAGACAGVTHYPVKDPNNKGKVLTPEEYSKVSENLGEYLFPVQLLNGFDRLNNNFENVDEMEHVLLKVKQALTNGNRLTIGTLLLLAPRCEAGACARNNAENDTWAITPEFFFEDLDIAAHEMVIYGYDDYAYAINQKGEKHYGLLRLRNSWGNDVGDQGDYYMTYDYFKMLVLETQEIQVWEKD